MSGPEKYLIAIRTFYNVHVMTAHPGMGRDFGLQVGFYADIDR